LSCAWGGVVNNQYYRVDSSDQGITSTYGAPISFTTGAPNITASITRTLDPIVVSDTVRFTATASTNGTPLSYAWNLGDGATATGLTTSHAYAQAGAYTIVFTATDTCGYTNVQTTTVTILPTCTPVTGLGFDYAPKPPVVQRTILFTATYTAGTPAPTLAWRFDSDALVSGANVAYTFTTTGTHTVAITATNTCGPVTFSGTVNVEPQRVYLPIVLRY
jgi:PKD repeat protein